MFTRVVGRRRNETCFAARGTRCVAASIVLAVCALAARAEDESARLVYRISPGDTVSIMVSERPDLSFQVRVPLEGDIVLPGAGTVSAAGLSVEELSHSITSRLKAEAKLVEPRVAVSVVAYGVRRAFVHGAVERPQAVDLPAEIALTLTQAVSTCGGFRVDADREHVRITRRPAGGPPSLLVVDAKQITEVSAAELDCILEPGDTIYVPQLEPVYVLGQVERPGAIQLPFGYPLTVGKAIAISGGFSKFARYTRVRVTRRTPGGIERFTMDLGDVLDGELDKDMELQAGDTVYVPERVF
jgi:protein involved in polysaccharide export with SLBB domain